MNNNGLKHNAKLLKLEKDISSDQITEESESELISIYNDELLNIKKCRILIKSGDIEAAQLWLGRTPGTTYGDAEDILQNWIWKEAI